MLTRTRQSSTAQAAPGEWGRGRLVAALMLLLLIGLSLAGGVVLWVWLRFHPPGSAETVGRTASDGSVTTAASGASGSSGQNGSSGPGGSVGSAGSAAGGTDAVQARRDSLAAAPMGKADLRAAQPSSLSVRDPGAIVLPASTSTGPVGIPSGFPHTPEGALAQLAALDTDVLTKASVDHARQVITAWAGPGGPTAQSWTGVQAIAGFLSAANLSPAGPAGGSGLVVRATPLMGMIKATDGPDWAVVCVDFEVDATLKASGQVAVADCQRLAWDAGQGRWLVGPGPEPAPAPSIWPGTDAAIDAGWKDLRHG